MKTFWKIAIGASMIILFMLFLFLFDPLHIFYKTFDSPDQSLFAQSSYYWRTQATPFSILDSQVLSSTGQGTFVLENKAITRLTLTKFQVGNGVNTTHVSFEAGEIKTISIAGVGGITFAGINTGIKDAGSRYELGVTIEYTNPNNVTVEQPVSNSLVGKYI